MARYIVNKNEQVGGDHEVHAPGCSYMPDVSSSAIARIEWHNETRLTLITRRTTR